MEMKDSLDMNESSFLGIGRQGYGLGAVEVECQANSSDWPVPDFASSSANPKTIRMDDGEIWHRKNDVRRSFSGELSQVQILPGSQRAKRQNCHGSIHDCCWNSIACSSNNLDAPGPGSNRTGVDSKANLGHSSSPDLPNCCKARETGPGISGFDFLQTATDVKGASSSSSFPASWGAGNGCEEVISFSRGALMEDNMGSWSGVTGSGSIGVRVADAGLLLTCFEDGLGGSEGKNTGDFMMNSLLQSPDIITGNCSTLDHQNRELQAPLNRIVNDPHGTVEVENMYSRTVVADQSTLDPSISSFAMAISDTEKREPCLQACSLASSTVDHMGSHRPGLEISGRRSSSKRKLSTSALIDGSSFGGSEIPMKRESSVVRIGGRSGPSRPNPNALSSTASPDPFPSSTSMIQIWDDLYNDKTGISGSENDLFESIRNSTGKTVDLHGTGGGAQRTLNHQSGSLRPEQSRSLFARNWRRSIPAQQVQASSSRRISSAEQVPEFGSMGSGITGAPHEFGQRSSTSPAVASWGGNNPLLRGNMVLPSFGAPVRERTSMILEGTYMRGSSGWPPNWMGAAAIESRPASQATTSRGNTSATARASNFSEGTVRTVQVDNSPFSPGMASSSQLSAFLSNRRSAGGTDRNVSPETNFTASFGSSLEVPLSAGSNAGPCPPVLQSSSFLGGQSEGILAAPVHSIFGMPFCGLHVLSADGEQRQRFFSEILAALEHSRRSEELGFEELVMLDPSLIYGGIDIHDQHSDMRLDVDNMSYEELLALEERIGDVSTGLNNETISKCLRESKYSSLDATFAVISEESDIKCSICQEEYVEEDDLGRLDCGHGYHTICISQWLSRKNQCPICKSTAYSP